MTALIPVSTGGGPRSRSPSSVAEFSGEEQQPSTKDGYVIDGYAIDGCEFHDDVSNQGRFSRFVEWYAQRLETHPVSTKTITSGILGVLGDFLAQLIELTFEDIGDGASSGKLDGRRSFAMFVDGLVFGPLMHYSYELYEHYFPILRRCNCVCQSGVCWDDDALLADAIDEKDNTLLTDKSDENATIVIPVVNVEADTDEFETDWTNVLIHVAFDQILMGMVYVFGFMSITALIEGHSLSSLAAELHDDYFRNLFASWAAEVFFAPIQIFTFGKISKEFRVLSINLLDMFWVTLMSILTHLHRDQSSSFIKTVLIPWLGTISGNIVDSTR